MSKIKSLPLCNLLVPVLLLSTLHLHPCLYGRRARRKHRPAIAR